MAQADPVTAFHSFFLSKQKYLKRHFRNAVTRSQICADGVSLIIREDAMAQADPVTAFHSFFLSKQKYLKRHFRNAVTRSQIWPIFWSAPAGTYQNVSN